MKKNLLGVDIGHSTIKVALVNHNQVTKAASVLLPETGLYEEPKEYHARISAALRDLLKREKIHASEAALCIPSDQVLIQTMDLPVMREAEVKRNLMFEFREQVEGEPEAYLYDYMSVEPPVDLPKDGAGRMYLIGAALPYSWLDEMREILRGAGLSLYSAVPEPATYKSMIRKSGATEGEFCFVDIGYYGTEVCLFHGDSYVTSQRLRFGIFELEDRIAEEEGISLAMAASCVSSNHQHCLEKESLLQAYEAFSLELNQALEYYRMSSLGSNLQDIWLLGGGTNIRPLIKTVLEKLNRFRMHPANNFLPELKQRGINGNLFIKACGAAMHQ